jgi:hypothetical protein
MTCRGAEGISTVRLGAAIARVGAGRMARKPETTIMAMTTVSAFYIRPWRME